MSAELAERHEPESALDASMRETDESDESERVCALSGRVLEPGELVEIISLIAQSTWRGELVVEDGAVMRSLFFDEGQLVAAESNAPEDRFREVLVRHHLLTADEVSACDAVTSSRALRFGEAVVELKLASRQAVFGWLAAQVETIAFAVMRMDRGAFAFFRGYDEGRLSFRRKHDVAALVERALREIDDARFFQAKIRGVTDIPKKTSCRTVPTRDPLGVYAAIDGVKSVAELARSVGLTELEVTRALYQHIQTGHARVTPKPLDGDEIVGIYNRAIAVLLRELDAMDEGDGVRAELAKYAGRAADRPAFVTAPADDGTFDAEAIAKHLRDGSSPLDAEQLARWLYDYASYALFLARPHLQRRYEAGSQDPRVSQRVADLLEPLAPGMNVTMPKAARAPRITVPAPKASVPARSEEPPRSSGTMRMRKVLGDSLPGIDPKRTVRIAPFTLPGSDGPVSGTIPTRSVAFGTTAASPVHVPLTRHRVPPPVAVHEPPPRKRTVSLRGTVVVIVALAVGTLIGWSARRLPHADAAPSPTVESAAK